MATLTKFAVRFIHLGQSRTYIVMDIGKFDAICTALELMECDVPEAANSSGLALIVKAYPEGAHLAVEGDGPIIDTTRGTRAQLPEREAIAA